MKQKRIRPLLNLLQFALFALLGWWVHRHSLLITDVTLARKMQKQRSPFLRPGAIALSYFNEHMVLNALVLPVGFVLWQRRLRLEAVMMVAATGLSNLWRVAAHRAVNRPRPSPLLVKVTGKPDGKSYPSGHVLGTLTFWGWLLALRPLLAKDEWLRQWQKPVVGIARTCIVTIGPARVYLGQHWPSDVLGGYLLGNAWVGLTYELYAILQARGVLASQ